MKDVSFRIGILIVALLFVFIVYRNGENGRYQIIQASIPMGTYYSPVGTFEVQQLNTVVRIDSRTGTTEYFQDVSQTGYNLSGLIKIRTFWTEMRDQQTDHPQNKQ